jgi:16S rRNA (cytidine1402-2'-O)-methyltransferase
MEETRKPGTLYIVATPIGNLEDITLRGLRTLRKVAAIACEDTRRTLKLLNKYRIRKELVSYFQPRENRKIPVILNMLRAGKDIALVSDSGTPGISDPGFRLVKEALREGLAVVPIPGPTALAAALSASGLSTHRFLFMGFPSPRKEAMKKTLASRGAEEATLIFYIPARKAVDFLEATVDTLGNRPLVLAREITKIHEEFIRGTAQEVLKSIKKRPIKGEIIILIAKLER